MATDLEGNVVKEGDIVYICEAARLGSRHKKLLRERSHTLRVKSVE